MIKTLIFLLLPAIALSASFRHGPWIEIEESYAFEGVRFERGCYPQMGILKSKVVKEELVTKAAAEPVRVDPPDYGSGIRVRPVEDLDKELNTTPIKHFMRDKTGEFVEKGIGTGFMVGKDASPRPESAGDLYYCPYNLTGTVDPILITARHNFPDLMGPDQGPDKPHPYHSFTFHMVKECARGIIPLEHLIATIRVPLAILRSHTFYHPGGDDLLLIEMHQVFEWLRGDKRLTDFLPLYYGLSDDLWGVPLSSPPEGIKPFGKMGSKAMLVGYPRGYYDHVNNFPMGRFGHCASNPNRKFGARKIGARKSRYGGDGRGSDSFTVDISSFKGQSGGPVFVKERMIEYTSASSRTIGAKVERFLGVFVEGFKDRNPISIGTGRGSSYKKMAEGLRSETMMNLGIVIHQRVVSELMSLWLKDKKTQVLRATHTPVDSGFLFGTSPSKLAEAMVDNLARPILRRADEAWKDERSKGKKPANTVKETKPKPEKKSRKASKKEKKRASDVPVKNLIPTPAYDGDAKEGKKRRKNAGAAPDKIPT